MKVTRRGIPVCNQAKVNADQRPDLICTFSVPATGFQLGDTVGVLAGQTKAGIAFEGRDTVRIIP